MARVLQLIHSLTGGGAARTMIATAKYSAQHGDYQHSVIPLNREASHDSAIAFARAEGLNVPEIGSRQELMEQIAAHDIVQVNWWQSPDMDIFLRSQIPSCRLIGWLHVAGDKPPQVVTKSMVEYFDLALGGSSYTHLAPAFQSLPPKLMAEKTGFVVGGADFARLRTVQKQPHSGFNIGYVGTVNYIKMHRDYVKMHSTLNIPDLKVIVCGGDQQDEVARQAEQLGVRDRFEFRGYVNDIEQVMSVFDVYGYPLCEDTYAASELNLQEAMYAGIPPVVFPHGGIKTLVINGETGLVVNSLQEYKEAIEYLYNNPAERLRLGESARSYATLNFGAELNAHKMNSYYGQLLQQPKRERQWPTAAATGLEHLLQSFDGTAPVFDRAAEEQSLERLLGLEMEIIGSTPLMLNSALLPYSASFPNDPTLTLWAGLGLLGNGRAAEAAQKFYEALSLGLPTFPERALYYIRLAAIEVGDEELAASATAKLLEFNPNWPVNL